MHGRRVCEASAKVCGHASNLPHALCPLRRCMRFRTSLAGAATPAGAAACWGRRNGASRCLHGTWRQNGWRKATLPHPCCWLLKRRRQPAALPPCPVPHAGMHYICIAIIQASHCHDECMQRTARASPGAPVTSSREQLLPSVRRMYSEDFFGHLTDLRGRSPATRLPRSVSRAKACRRGLPPLCSLCLKPLSHHPGT